jgi:hypothetical protein
MREKETGIENRKTKKELGKDTDRHNIFYRRNRSFHLIAIRKNHSRRFQNAWLDEKNFGGRLLYRK